MRLQITGVKELVIMHNGTMMIIITVVNGTTEQININQGNNGFTLSMAKVRFCVYLSGGTSMLSSHFHKAAGRLLCRDTKVD